MNIEKALINGAEILKQVSDRPRLEAEILMSYLLEKDRLWLHSHSREILENSEAFFSLVNRRSKYEPIEYITGKVSFYDIDLCVGPGVLIARPETELLVDEAAKIIEKESISFLTEVGVGSGAISIMLARKFPNLRIIAVDISERALEYAHKNISRYGLKDRIELRYSNLLDNVSEKVQMVISNPPYIANNFTFPAPLRYEPENALIGGERGDEILRRLIKTCHMRDAEHLVCEMGYDQKEPIKDFCQKFLDIELDFYKDLAGLDRGFYIRMNKK